MKKLTALFLMLMASFLTLLPSLKASTVLTPEPPVNTGGLWHVIDENRAYVNMRYTASTSVRATGGVANDPENDLDYSRFTSWAPNPTYNENFFFPNTVNPKSASISNPNPALYDKFVVEIIANMEPFGRYNVPDPGPASYKLIGSYNNVNTVAIDFVDYVSIQDIAHINLKIDGNQVLSSRSNLDHNNTFFYDIAFGVRMYWESSTPIDIGDDIDPGGSNPEDPPGEVWNQLPATTGSPKNPSGVWGYVTDLSVSNQTISFKVNYQGTQYSVIPFTVDGNLDFINKSNDVLYYTDPDSNDRMLYFNFGESIDSAILASQQFSQVNNWKGEALWNLTNNEIKTTNKLSVYNYIPEVDNDLNVFSYFYMPDVPMDNLISVSAVLAYRYFDRGFLGLGKLRPGEIEYKTVAAVRGETSSVNPTWVEKTYKTAYITSILTATATITGKIPGYGWLIAGATLLVGSILNIGDINEWFAYDVNQIEHVIPSISLSNDINAYISSHNPHDTFSPDTDKLYRLHLATLQDKSDVQVMGELSNITQVVWETDGQIFVVDQEDILNHEWGGPGTEIPQSYSNFDTIIWIGAVVVFMILYKNFNLSKKPGLLLIVGGVIVYVLYELGMF